MAACTGNDMIVHPDSQWRDRTYQLIGRRNIRSARLRVSAGMVVRQDERRSLAGEGIGNDAPYRNAHSAPLVIRMLGNTDQHTQRVDMQDSQGVTGCGKELHVQNFSHRPNVRNGNSVQTIARTDRCASVCPSVGGFLCRLKPIWIRGYLGARR